MAGQNGGGAFVLVYLVCVFAIGLPIMMSEILLGRRGRRSPVGTMRILGQEEAGQSVWQLVGVVGVVAGVLILSFYSVIAGWTMAYFVKAVRGDFQGLGPEQASEAFAVLTSSSGINSVWHTVFMFVTIAVVARGVERGLEKAVRVMVPALFALLIALLFYAVTSGDFSAGLEFMFRPDFSKVTGTTILAAMGQAFFTLSIGMGAVMAYGAYLPPGCIDCSHLFGSCHSRHGYRGACRAGDFPHRFCQRTGPC